MIEVTLYSRSECKLCDQTLADLEEMQKDIPFKLNVIDIDARKTLRERYGTQIPVVEVGPYRLKAPIDRKDLEISLRAVQTRDDHIRSIQALDEAAEATRPWTKSDSFTYWLARHYMFVFNLFVLIYVGLPFLAPALISVGATGPASLIYRGYGMVCHQLAYRSFFLFGEQGVYPRTAAGVDGLVPFAQATGFGESNTNADIDVARSFIGNERLGYKVALCERDVAIYGAILLFGVLFSLSGRRIPPLHWALWILIGLVPVGLDGFSQLLSQPPFNFIQYRESTPLLRVLTGSLFGFFTAWFGYPLVEVSMVDTRNILGEKLTRLKNRNASQKSTTRVIE